MKGKPNAAVYQLKKEVSSEFERMSRNRLIDLYYGDESGVSLEPNVPYGWQFWDEEVSMPSWDEEVSMPSNKGKGINCFALVTRRNQGWTAQSEQTIDGSFVMEQLERFSFFIRKMTVVVLDNARIHHSKQIRERTGVWQARGLFVFYLPTYSPHLNIAETLWRKLKYEWLAPEDYASKEHLQYAVKQALQAFGTSLKIKFSDFKDNLT